ncbi:MAG TPA: histidine kinase [Streptosporangiaceae bacterium]|jgi:signal transduction histidine kinase
MRHGPFGPVRPDPAGPASSYLFRNPWFRVWFPVAIALGVVTSDPKPGLRGVHLTVLVGLICCLISVYLLFWLRDRPTRWLWAPAYAMVVSSIVLFGVSPHGSALGFAYGAIWLSTWTLALWQAAGLALTGVCGVAVLAWLGLIGDSPAIGLGIGFVATITASYAVRERRIARAEAETARAAQEGEAALAERARIAREIHDILAHSLSAQIVHLEGARLLLQRGDESGAALDRVERAQRLARTGLEETKRALSALRGDAPPVGEVLRGLADEFQAVSESRCDVTVQGAEVRLPAGTSLAVVRTAQEALTNARRHAPGADVAVDLRFGTDGWCELRVVNKLTEDPEPGTPGSGGGGYGLVGMRERAELLGGSLSAVAEDGEFRVLLRVPV